MVTRHHTSRASERSCSTAPQLGESTYLSLLHPTSLTGFPNSLMPSVDDDGIMIFHIAGSLGGTINHRFCLLRGFTHQVRLVPVLHWRGRQARHGRGSMGAKTRNNAVAGGLGVTRAARQYINEMAESRPPGLELFVIDGHRIWGDYMRAGCAEVTKRLLGRGSDYWLSPSSLVHARRCKSAGKGC